MEIAILRVREKMGFWGRVRAFFGIIGLFIHGAGFESKRLLRLYGEQITIETDDEVVWDLDGEKGDTGNTQIRLLPNHVMMFVPKNKKI